MRLPVVEEFGHGCHCFCLSHLIKVKLSRDTKYPELGMTRSR